MIAVHLNHPCSEIDVCEVSEQDFVSMRDGQGYVSLKELRSIVAERDALRAQVAQCKAALQATAEYMGEPKPMDEGRTYPDMTQTRYSPWATATNNVIALVRAALEAVG